MRSKLRNGSFVTARGRAEWVQQSTRAQGGRAGAFLEVRFLLGNLRVTSRVFGQSFDVADGHDTIVAGHIQGGELWPVAWWNCTMATGYSPRVWEFWPCVAGVGLLLSLLGVRLGLGTLSSQDLWRMAVPFLLLTVLAWSAFNRRKAVQAVEAIRAGKPAMIFAQE